MNTRLIAQTSESLGEITGEGSLGEISSADAPEMVNRVASIFVGLLTAIAGLYFLAQLLIGAINWIGAGGDKVKIEEARKKISNGLIGLAIVISAIFIIRLIGTIFGLPFLTSPGDFISGLWS